MSMAAQLYMQLQPDWHELISDNDSGARADVHCWLDVYERSVCLDDDDSSSSEAVDVQQRDGGGARRVHIDAPASAHFELDLSNPRSAMTDAASLTTPHQEHLVEVVKQEQQWIEVLAHTRDQRHERRTVRTVFQSPTAIMGDTGVGVRRPQLHTVDVSSDEKFIAVGGADGHCALWDAFERTESFVLPGHVSDVTTARFFPSGVVLLTGSLDFTLRIWSVVSGQCAAVLKGHRSGIEDTAILGRGRNVLCTSVHPCLIAGAGGDIKGEPLACSSDGLIHMWSCGTQEVIAKWGNDAQSAVHCLSVLNDAASNTLAQGDASATSPPAPHDLEAETEGKVLFAGLENGGTLGIDIRMRELVMNLRGTGPILSCAAASHTGTPVLFTGSDDGMLTTWDLRSTSVPLQLRSRSAAPIHRIALSQSAFATSSSTDAALPRVWTAHGDGVCCTWGDAVAGGVLTQLTGSLYDPIRAVAVAPRTGRVFTAGRDGLVRDYIPHVLLA